MSEPVNSEVFKTFKEMEGERHQRHDTRLKALEESNAKLTEVSVQLSEILKNQRAELEDHENRLDAIEHRPNQLIDKIISALISLVVSGVGVAIMYYISNMN